MTSTALVCHRRRSSAGREICPLWVTFDFACSTAHDHAPSHHPSQRHKPVTCGQREPLLAASPTVPAVPLDPELVVPAPVEARPVRLHWSGPQSRLDQRDGARQNAALCYARMTEGHPAAMTGVYRFLDAWQEFLWHALPQLADALQPLSDTQLETGTGDVFAEWAELSWMVWRLWPDTAADVGAADRAIVRLRAAFTATAVDVAAVHREMLAVDAFFGGLEARAQAESDARRDGLGRLG